MKLDMIEIPVEEAKARLDEYTARAYEERTVEDDAIAAGYRAAARGLPVIMLSEVISAGGWFGDGLPRLAVARADTERVTVEVNPWWSNYSNSRWVLQFLDDAGSTLRAAHVGRHGVQVQVAAPVEQVARRRSRGSTVVPIIPPRFRPRRQARLKGLHVLWEVERWDPTPPVDPALLRHIRGDLWAVLAVWDLTPLERAVLAQRA